MKLLHLTVLACLFSVCNTDAVNIVPKSAAKYKITWTEVSKPPRAVGPVWTQYRANLRSLGYETPKINSEYIPHLELNFPHYLLAAAKALGMEEWKFDKILSEADYQLITNDYHLSIQILSTLGFWTQVSNFDTGAFLNAVYHTEVPLAAAAIEPMLAWSHLWIDSEGSLDWALWFLDKTKKFTYTTWFLERLDDESKERFGERVKEILQEQTAAQQKSEFSNEAAFLMGTAAFVPEKYQPTNFKRRLAKMGWNGNSKRSNYPALITDSIQLMHHGSYQAGNCQNMSRGHLFTLGIAKPLAPEVWKNTVVISVQGQIVGAMKREGDPSMVALRNVRNSDGKQVLSIGGVYLLPLKLVPSLPRRAAKSQTWIGVNLPELRVKPSDFLLNQNAWPHIDTKHWSALSGLTESQIEGMEAGQFQKMATEAVLENLDCVRLLLQNS